MMSEEEELFKRVREKRLAHIIKQLKRMPRTDLMNIENYIDNEIKKLEEVGLIDKIIKNN